MLLLWTIIDEQFLLPNQPMPVYKELLLQGTTVQCEELASHVYRIDRIISTNPADFLNQSLQPGKIIEWSLPEQAIETIR